MSSVDAGSSGDVTVELGADYIATIEIHRPPNNFFDTSLLESIASACEHLATSTDCRVIMLCSEGRHFCAGVDFSSASGGDRRYEPGIRLLEQPLPIVAVVQGAAIGGGLGLAMVAD